MKFDHLIENIIAEKKTVFMNDSFTLTEEQVSVLNRYNIPFESCHSTQELIFCIEEVLDSGIMDDSLESISISLAEHDYYQNYKK